MNKQERFCTIEKTKKLIELGVDAESTWYYLTAYGDQIGQRCDKGFVIVEDGSVYTEDMPDEHVFNAFTLAELAKPVYKYIDSEESEDEILDDVIEGYTEVLGFNFLTIIYNPNYVADCLIHLLQKGVLTPEQVNSYINE